MLGESTEPIPLTEEDPERGAGSRAVPWGRIFFALLWMVLTVGVVAFLGVSWFGELDRRKSAEGEVASAQTATRTLRASVAELESERSQLAERLTSARSSLAKMRARWARRGVALRYARRAATLQPLEKSYGELGEALAALSADRAALAAAATALAREAASLNDYVRKTAEGALSKAELRRLIRALQVRASALRAAQARLAVDEASYDEAAERLDESFDDLGRSLAALRKQIMRALRR